MDKTWIKSKRQNKTEIKYGKKDQEIKNRKYIQRCNLVFFWLFIFAGIAIYLSSYPDRLICDPECEVTEICKLGVCHCGPGFEPADDGTCGDVDECIIGNSCPDSSVCVNTYGTYGCSCKNGYSLDADFKTCEDIDECFFGTECPDIATCKNYNGYYTCDCPKGYEMKDSICEDINECRSETHRCDKNAICGNSVGSYICDCKQGGNWYGDGFDCYYHDPCWNSPCKKYSICKSDPTVDDKTACTCLSPLSGDGKIGCDCGVGFEMHGTVTNLDVSDLSDQIECMDIDECLLGTHLCDPFATCTNNFGAYDCYCDDGFTGDGNTCSDIDELGFQIV